MKRKLKIIVIKDAPEARYMYTRIFDTTEEACAHIESLKDGWHVSTWYRFDVKEEASDADG